MSAGIERFVPKEHREVKGGYRFRNIIRPAIQATKRYVIIFATDFIIKQYDKRRNSRKPKPRSLVDFDISTMKKLMIHRRETNENLYG